MKLYVWCKYMNWSKGKFFCAMAENQEQARGLLLEKPDCFPEDLNHCADEYEFPVAFVITRS